MPSDSYLPPGLSLSSAGLRAGSPPGSPAAGAADPERLPLVLGHLREAGARALQACSEEDLWRAWTGTVDAFLDRRSTEREALEDRLTAGCRLSPAGLQAGLEAVLGGVRGEAARRLLRQGYRRRGEAAAGIVSVFLASNLPALAVQPLLPILALGRPALFKAPSAEPFFTAAFCAALAARLPDLGEGLAALCWQGGDNALEAVVLAGSAKVIAYGEAETLADLEARSPAPLVGYGPRVSLAAVGPGSSLPAAALGLARDVALFDQRGCLSVHGVYVAANGPTERPKEQAKERATELARLLARELASLARRWPPGAPLLQDLAAVRQLRGEAEMRGLVRFEEGLREGTVVVEPEPAFQPSPGLRTVRVFPWEDLEDLPARLAPWKDRLQGISLAGREPAGLRERLEALGVSRFAPPGELQTPDAAWHNGGLHPLEALA